MLRIMAFQVCRAWLCFNLEGVDVVNQLCPIISVEEHFKAHVCDTVNQGLDLSQSCYILLRLGCW